MKRKSTFNFIFLTCFLLSALAFCIQALVWGLKEPYVFALPVFRDIREVPFADFWHVNYIVHENSPYYGDMASYPPLVLLFALLFVPFADYSKGYETAYTEGFRAELSLYLFYLIFAFLFCLLLFRILEKKGFSLPSQIAIVVASFFTMGMVYNYERGNYILYALLPALFFYGYYDSEKPVLREISYVCLGISAGIKLYPALFALILLRKRQFFPFFRCVAYTVLALLLPFFFLDRGLANINQFVRWLVSFAVWQANFGYNYSISNFLGILSSVFGGMPLEEVVTADYNLIALISLALPLLCGLVLNKPYKVFLAACVGMILFPNPSFYYSATFLTLPLVALLAERKKDAFDVLYGILFFLVLTPVYLGEVDAGNSLYVNQFIESFALIGMELLLIVDAAITLYQKRDRFPKHPIRRLKAYAARYLVTE